MKSKRSTFGVLFYLNTSKRKKSGLCPVMGRITVDGVQSHFSLKEDAHPDYWDAGKGRATGKNSEQTALNKKINQMEQFIRDIYARTIETCGYVTAEQIKNVLTGVGCKAETFLKLFEEHNLEYQQRVGVDRTKSTYYIYRNGLHILSDFIKSKYGLDDYPLKKLNESFIKDYDYYLRVDCRMSTGTVLGQIIRLKRVVNRAVRQGVLLRNPFADFIPERPRWKYRNIPGEELEKILQTPVASPEICFTRDMFVFSCFTGLSYSDIRNLSLQHLKKEADGSQWIVINRQKTGGESIIRLLDIPLQIIEKYRPKRKGDRLFNMVSSGSISRNLRKIETLCSTGHLQFHMARHTFATQICIMQGGLPMETISKMMGHKTMETTKIYAEITNQKVGTDMKKLAGRTNGKYSMN